MAFKPDSVSVDLNRLKSTLLKSGIQQDNNPLYEVIRQLINAIEQVKSITGDADRAYLTHASEAVKLPKSRELIAGTNVTFNDAIANQRILNATGSASETYITVDDESGTLANSRRLLAGTNITFDDATPNERTVSASGGGGSDGYWVPITDGDEVNPEIIYGGGEVIVGFVPTP